MAGNYSSTTQKVGLGWLKSDNEAVRLVAIEAMRRNDDDWAADQLIEALDDAYLLNRQFAAEAVEKVLGIDLENAGYKFYMTPSQRKVAIDKIRQLPRLK